MFDIVYYSRNIMLAHISFSTTLTDELKSHTHVTVHIVYCAKVLCIQFS